MRKHGELISVTLPLLLISLMFLSVWPMANADLPVQVTSGPSSAVQGIPFEFSVTVVNFGNSSINIIFVGLTIVWPDQNFLSTEENHTIFNGTRSILPGTSETFSNRISSESFGSFATIVEIDAQKIDGNVTKQSYQGQIDLQGASSSDTNSSPIWIAILIFLIIFGAMWIGFYYTKWWYKEEIDNALGNYRNPGFIMLLKWYPFYWEDSGKMWLNYLLWSAISLILAGMFYLILR